VNPEQHGQVAFCALWAPDIEVEAIFRANGLAEGGRVGCSKEAAQLRTDVGELACRTHAGPGRGVARRLPAQLPNGRRRIGNGAPGLGVVGISHALHLSAAQGSDRACEGLVVGALTQLGEGGKHQYRAAEQAATETQLCNRIHCCYLDSSHWIGGALTVLAPPSGPCESNCESRIRIWHSGASTSQAVPFGQTLEPPEPLTGWSHVVSEE
jgi:hypothetical protein